MVPGVVFQPIKKAARPTNGRRPTSTKIGAKLPVASLDHPGHRVEARGTEVAESAEDADDQARCVSARPPG